MSQRPAAAKIRSQANVSEIRDAVELALECGTGKHEMNGSTRDYSEDDHRYEFKRLRARIAESTDASELTNLSNLAELVSPDTSTIGVRVPFDISVRTAMPHLIKYLPNLTAPGFEGTNFSKSLDAFILDASGGMILQSGALWIDGQIIISDIQHVGEYRRHGAPWPIASRLRASSYDPLSKTAVVEVEDAEELDDRYVYLVLDGRISRGNFGHFVHDLLYQLPAIDKLIAEFGDKLKIILSGRPQMRPQFVYPIQQFIMDKLKLSDRIVKVDGKAVRLARGFVASRPMSMSGLHTYSARYCKYKIRSALQIDSRMATGPFYYISRGESNASSRHFENQVEMENILNSFGVVPVVVGELAAPDIVEIFSEAGGIVGVHGAGLMNILLADEAAPLIELSHQPRVWDSVKAAASVWRHRFARVPLKYAQTNSIDCAGLANEMSTLLGRQ